MRPGRSSIWLFVTVTGTACAGGTGNAPADSPDSGTEAAASECEPIESREPNAPDQQPSFPGQTRACEIDSGVAYEVEVLTDELVHPWAVEPLPGGELLVTERPGRLRIISAAGDLGDPIGGLPPVDAKGQGGLLDVALSPSFESDRTIYWSYAEPRQGGNGTTVARGVLAADGRRVENVEVIVRTMPTYAGSLHFGSRLAFGPDGMLYITLGDRSDAPMRPHAQRLDSHLGSILRVAPDGSIPPDNPFVGRDDALGEIWTLGHRNVQAAAFDAEGRLWVVEHGARGGDELNLIEKGGNYGWPLQAYGIEYSGRPISGASPAPTGYEQPVYYWDPVIAPSGAQFHTGDAFPEWRGSLFIGALREQRLVRLALTDGRVTGEEHLLADRGQRIRDVRQGPDGALYVVTDEERGELWRITPRRGSD
ncbi:MAG TPA: PQQ-dependent sugar dehydrogenase [Longimicrobiales bacterium]|nr:PQQ-dependent sugar dehydrogenase [Longimicrobiales bacterium]